MTDPGDAALALLGELAASDWLGLGRRGRMIFPDTPGQYRGVTWCDYCDGEAVEYTPDAAREFVHAPGCPVRRTFEFLRGK